MGKKLRAVIFCDMCGEDLDEDPVHREIGTGGKLAVLELCKKDDEEVGETLARYVKAASATGSYTRQLPKAAAPKTAATTNAGVKPKRGTGNSDTERAKIREWALANGIMKSRVGRIPHAVVDAYNNQTAAADGQPARTRRRAVKKAAARPGARRRSAARG